MLCWYGPKPTHGRIESNTFAVLVQMQTGRHCIAWHDMTALNDEMLKLLSFKIYVNICMSALRAFEQFVLNAKMNNESSQKSMKCIVNYNMLCSGPNKRAKKKQANILMSHFATFQPKDEKKLKTKICIK